MNSIQLYLSRSKKLLFVLAFLVLGCLPIVSQAAACKFIRINNGAIITDGSLIGGVMSTIVQNKSSVAPIDIRYRLSCTEPSSRVRVTIIDRISQSKFYERSLKPSIERFQTELRPTLFTDESWVKFIRQSGNGPTLSTMFDPPNDRIVGDTGTFYYQGPFDLTIVFTNGNKYLFSNDYVPRMRSAILEIYPITIEIEDSSGTKSITAFMADTFEVSKNQCNISGFTVTTTPNKINFGDISKQSFEQGAIAQRDFSLNVTRNKSNCTTPLRPKVVFTTPETVVNNQDIKLSNGLLLSLKDGANGRPLEIGKVIEYYNQIDTSLQIKYKAELRKNPGEAIKSGPFSTALVYLVEYY